MRVQVIVQVKTSKNPLRLATSRRFLGYTASIARHPVHRRLGRQELMTAAGRRSPAPFPLKPTLD